MRNIVLFNRPLKTFSLQPSSPLKGKNSKIQGYFALVSRAEKG
jgi:hypothetical protein